MEKIFWDTVLGGRYVAKLNPVAHAVATCSIRVGRIKRERGETLCGRIAPEHMSTGGASDSCPRCQRCEALTRLVMETS